MLSEQLLPYVLFEALEPAGGDVGVVEPGPDPTPSLDPGAGGPGGDPDPVPSPTPAPAPAAIDWDSPNVQAELERRADAALQARLAAAGLAPAPADEPGFELDPFSDNFGEQLIGVLGAVLDQRLSPVDSLMQEQTVQGFEQTINGEISKLTGHGVDDAEQAKAAEFYGLDPEGVRFLGEAFASRVDPRSENPVGDALRQGATWLKGYLDRERTAAVDDYKRQIGEIVDTPAEPSGSGGALRMEPRARGYDDIISRHTNRFEQ